MSEWDTITVSEEPLRFYSEDFDVSDPDFATRFCEGIVDKDPKNIEALTLLGHAYTRRGDYEKGLAVDIQLVLLRPWDGVAVYNLACSYALTGETADALNALRHAFELGYRDVESILQDDDLASLHNLPEFRRMIAEWVAREGAGDD